MSDDKLTAALRVAVLALDAYASEGISVSRENGADVDAIETLHEIAALLGCDDLELLIEQMLPGIAT